MYIYAILGQGLLAEVLGFQTALAVNYAMVLPLIFIAFYRERVEHQSTLAV